MARPQKKGLDYFPLDVTMDKTDDDIEILEAKYGVEGFCILIKLYMKIYQEEGYFVKWNEKTSLLHSKRVNVDINLVNNVINDLVSWGVFNKELFEAYSVITSRRIQETYIEACKKRKEVEIIESLILLEGVNSNINLVNSDIYPQSKEKKSKVNKSKVNKTILWGLADGYSDDLKLAYKDFETMRKSIKKPLTERAAKGIITKVDNFANDDETKIKILENSIEHCWQTVYELKGNNNKGGKKPNDDAQNGSSDSKLEDEKKRLAETYGNNFEIEEDIPF